MTEKIYDITEYREPAEEIAAVLQYNVQYVRILARTGKLPAIKRGRQWMFCKQEILDNLRDSNPSKNTIDERQTKDEERIAQESDLF